MKFSDSVSCVKGIGPARFTELKKINIITVKDLCEYYPKSYKDRSKITSIRDADLDTEAMIKAKVEEVFPNKALNAKIITKIKVSDNTGVMYITWFNQPYLNKKFKKKSIYIFTGKVSNNFDILTMDNPEYEDFEKYKESFSFGRIVPVYITIKGIAQKVFRGSIYNALKEIDTEIEEDLPKTILEEEQLKSKNFSINNIHFPKDDKIFFEARYNLVFREFFIMQVAMQAIKKRNRKETTLRIFSLEEESFLKLLPFSLTNSQKKVIKEIKTDLQSKYAMNRLIQGDVGSGKTAVAMLISYLFVKEGFQVAIMVPTEVLAKQHFVAFKLYFNKLGFNVGLLSGSLKKKEKLSTYEEIENGNINVIIGTHAIIQDGVRFKNLALVVTDEQHRFGVKQRLALSEKGNMPHILIMTATPIPRTLAMVLHIDMDISIIDELPPSRKEIETFAVTSAYRQRIYKFIDKEIVMGRQAYVVCPMIEEDEKLELESVLKYTEDLKKELIQRRIVCLHGKMKGIEKESIMTNFLNKEIDILVSTTVIEVGINVPNATVMLIENSERFGLSQLHQLRGRVGRGSEKSYCILVTDSKSKVSLKRMKAMKEYSDGFKLSELDLQIRGAGDFFGTKQHGLPEFKIADIYEDMKVFKKASACAWRFLKKTTYQLEEKQFLKETIEHFISNGEVL